MQEALNQVKTVVSENQNFITQQQQQLQQQ